MLNRRTSFRILIGTLAVAFAVLSANASTFSFKPNDGEGDTDDMLDLDHYKYFTWGFKNFSVPAGETITNATLTIYNINNWTADENGYWKKVNGVWVLQPENWLNIWLLDSVANTKASTDGKLTAYNDTDGGPDYFAGWNSSAKTKIATYTDWNGGNNGDVVNLTFSFSSLGLLDELQAYVNNGNNFALGLDPDCHYWNTGVKLVIETAPYSVPETSGTLGLAGLGLGLLAAIRSRLRR